MRDEGHAIDASGQLTDGTRVDGVDSLRQALLKRPDVFIGTLTEKLLTYALGRGLDYYDMPAVRAIVREASARNSRFSSLVLGIVRSVPFQMRRRPDTVGLATNRSRKTHVHHQDVLPRRRSCGMGATVASVSRAMARR
jgi:hypothetical protein